MKKTKLKLAIVTTVLLLVGCQQTQNTNELVGSITAVGSSALQPLVEVASEHFQQQHPEVMINVQGGGSGQGLSQIMNGTVEIGNSDIFAEDKKVDVTKYNIVDNKVAVVGVGPIVNHAANVKNVTKEQLIAIFTGKITNWEQVGGADLPIVVINRANGSGSRKTFEQFGLNGEEPMSAQEQDNSGTVKKLVADTKGAISYVSFSYFDENLYTSLTIDNVAPTRQNVETNAWEIWAYEHMYIAKDADAVTRSFIDYMFSEKVQEDIIPELGYIPVRHMQVDRDAYGHVKVIK